MKERQPIPSKYREFQNRANHPDNLPFASRSTREAYGRMLNGTETPIDRHTIFVSAYRAHWGIEDEEEQTQNDPANLDAFSRTINPVDDARRYAKYYKGFMKRVFHLQAKVNQSPDGIYSHIGIDSVTGDQQITTITQDTINSMATMAYGMRGELQDRGYQTVINQIDSSLGVTWEGNIVKRSLKGGEI